MRELRSVSLHGWSSGARRTRVPYPMLCVTARGVLISTPRNTVGTARSKRKLTRDTVLQDIPMRPEARRPYTDEVHKWH